MLYVPFSEKEINSTGDYTSSLAGHVCYYYFFPLVSSLLPLYHFFLRSIHAVQNQIINPLKTRSYFILHLYSTWPNKNAWSWLWPLALLYTQVRQSHPHTGAAPSWLSKCSAFTTSEKVSEKINLQLHTPIFHIVSITNTWSSSENLIILFYEKTVLKCFGAYSQNWGCLLQTAFSGQPTRKQNFEFEDPQ